jgi:hypothetical protein
MSSMDRFDDVSVVASVDESPPPPRVPRRARRAFAVAVASVVVAGTLAGAAVGLADEKSEPAASAPSAVEGTSLLKRFNHPCHRGEHRGSAAQSSGSMRY